MASTGWRPARIRLNASASPLAVVFSSTTSTVDWNTRLVTGDAVTEITRLKADDGERSGEDSDASYVAAVGDRADDSQGTGGLQRDVASAVFPDDRSAFVAERDRRRLRMTSVYSRVLVSRWFMCSSVISGSGSVSSTCCYLS